MNFLLVYCMVFTIFFAHFAGAAEYPISSGRPIEKRADSIYEMVSKELVFVANKKDKFKSIQMTIEQLRRLLNGEETTIEQTAYIKDYITALKSLPSVKVFKSVECESYQVEEKARPLLQSLCGLQ